MFECATLAKRYVIYMAYIPDIKGVVSLIGSTDGCRFGEMIGLCSLSPRVGFKGLGLTPAISKQKWFCHVSVL